MKEEHTLEAESISAWEIGSDVWRIQANTPEAAKLAAKIPGARRSAYSVAGAYLQTFDIKSNAVFVARICSEIRGAISPVSRTGDFYSKREA